MSARPLSVAALGALALGAAVLFGVSGCDQLQEWADAFADHHGDQSGPGDAGGGEQPIACASSNQCATGNICTTETGTCNPPPGCRSNSGTACPAVCYGVCKPSSAGVACGKATCGAGEVCCNASCGICTAPNVGCVALACTDDPPPVTCAADSDCRLTADYCTGCDCRALGPKDAPKECVGPAISCLVNPCMQKTAVCVNGQCTVAAAPTRN